jgi:hypothetical protein
MTPEVFLTHLLRRGSMVQIVGEKLRVDAPYGVLSPEIKETLATHKPALLRLLTFADQYRDILHGANPVDPAIVDELGPTLALAVRDAVLVSDAA